MYMDTHQRPVFRLAFEFTTQAENMVAAAGYIDNLN